MVESCVYHGFLFSFCRSAAQEEQLCTGAKWGDHSIRDRKSRRDALSRRAETELVSDT